jgi:4-hydroxybenzoate polyprenyltransferase
MIWVDRLFRPGWMFYLGLAVAAGLIAIQYRMIRDREPADCFRAFRNNNWVGAAIFVGIFASFFFQKHI